MASSMTVHTFSACKTWPSYHAAYLQWMIQHDSPDLRTSNYNADRLREELRYQKEVSRNKKP